MNGKTISPINITSKIMKGILVVVFCRCIKGKLYVTCVRSAMIYGRETWAVTAGAEWEMGTYRDEDGEMDVWCIAEG